MSSKIKNYLIVLLAAATVCAGLVAWNLTRRVHALESALAEASAKSTRSAVLPRTARPLDASMSDTPVATPESEPAKIDPTTLPIAVETPPQLRASRGNFAALMANPEFAKAMSLQQRASLDARYADLFKQLRLPPDQLERLKDLLVERQTARMDVLAAARESGLNPRDNRDELRKLTEEAQTEIEANIAATLGEDAYRRYRTYEATQPQRHVVGQLDQRLAYSGTPLNPSQSDFLISVLGAGGQTDNNPSGSVWSGGGRIAITDDVLVKAQSVLSSDQLNALKQLKAEQDAQQKMRELMRGSGGGPRN